MAKAVKLEVRKTEGHVRVHADYGLVHFTTGDNVEVQFCRDVVQIPQEPISCELCDDGMLRPKEKGRSQAFLTREVLASVRMRPDHAYALGVELIRMLQQMAARGEEGEVADANDSG